MAGHWAGLIAHGPLPRVRALPRDPGRASRSSLVGKSLEPIESRGRRQSSAADLGRRGTSLGGIAGRRIARGLRELVRLAEAVAAGRLELAQTSDLRAPSSQGRGPSGPSPGQLDLVQTRAAEALKTP